MVLFTLFVLIQTDINLHPMIGIIIYTFWLMLFIMCNMCQAHEVTARAILVIGKQEHTIIDIKLTNSC
jgi:hypothetical protein